MNNLRSKTKKLIMALDQLGFIFIVHQKQFYSDRLSKVCKMFKITEVVDNETYRKNHPKSKTTRPTMEEDIFESFSEIEILLKLVEAYKLAKEQVANEKAEKESTTYKDDDEHEKVCGRVDNDRKQNTGIQDSLSSVQERHDSAGSKFTPVN